MPDFTWLTVSLEAEDDLGNVPPTLKPWVELSQKRGVVYPWLFFIDQEGRWVWDGALPVDVDSVISLVEYHLGDK